MKIRCVALDDEPLALKLLSEFLSKIEFLQLEASFSSTPDALKYISEKEIDCIFLDIEMPGLNGIDLSKILNNFTKKPEIVFVSAYGKYAVDGFKPDGADFLLKPYSFEELKDAAQKVLNSIEFKNTKTTDDSFFIKIDAQQVKLISSEILYIESMRDYVKIYTKNRDVPYIPLMTLKKIKTVLNGKYFLQINRSQIINISKISAYGKNSLTVTGKKFAVTGKFQKEFERRKLTFV
ncbi:MULTISPECIES: LytTR family DNA-binding domain-containing protein [Chryseobacterium]|uniref:Transcriptional regulatory protein YpdB n=1 Tax=Chryseobacterium salivictor TaxID=2547600 RepID=A0A4V1ALD5_9FLAO|nr:MULTISPECIES: LytTR family DNA-binding domain-containing protein [Chryseobacterium]MDQ0477308.1 DNA-binding LytR/AlgR family response regulator [Chryseobacterium sp. MDT2-18]QBO59384.1 Transcriptional regulatory protein YpdB [Chryseobacterium salivictor]